MPDSAKFYPPPNTHTQKSKGGVRKFWNEKVLDSEQDCWGSHHRIVPFEYNEQL